MRLHDGIVGGKGLELIPCRHKRESGEGRDIAGDGHIITFRRVEARTHSGTAQRQLRQVGQRVFDCPDAERQLRGIAAELLSEGERCGVHQVGAPNLDHTGHLFRSGGQRLLQQPQPRDGHLYDLLVAGDMHRGGKGIVGGL